MSENKDIQQLMREGIEVARAGDKAAARDKFEQVTDQDEKNEKAWFWLASVVESSEEKRVCLNNVLVINPNNERARQILERLDAASPPDDEVVPGISRRQLMLIGGGGGIVILLLLGLVLMINNTARQREAEERAAIQAQTQEFLAISARQTEVAATQIAMMDTATPLPPANILPTEIPPTETPTATATEFRLPAPPASIAGAIAAWGGRDVLSNGALEPRVYTIGAGDEFSLAGDDLGRDVRFAQGNSRIVYTRYFPSTFDFGLETINANGTQQETIRASAVSLSAGQPDICESANRLVFVGTPLDRPVSNDQLSFGTVPGQQVFVVDMANVPESGDISTATIRITNDAATYSYPAFSPDCTQVAVIRDDVNSAQPGADLYLIDIETRALTQVTTDLGTFVESRPRWTPDGLQLIFAAAPSNEPNNNDIVLVNADGSGVPTVLVRDASDDAYPVMSPDGQYIAFSSNRQGYYHVYIRPLHGDDLWQLTTTNENVFVGDWR